MLTPTCNPSLLTTYHTRDQVFLVFLAINLLWFSAALSTSLQYIEGFVQLMNLVGGKAAWPALWNLAIIVFPVNKVAVILAISHRDLNYCHIWAGNAILFWLSIHTILISVVYAIEKGSLSEWIFVMVPQKTLYSEGIVNFVGWIGFAAYLVLWTSSLPCFRARFYECFSWFHLLFSILFVLFSNLHDYNTLHFIQPAAAAWIADRLLRRYSSLTTCVRQHYPSDGNSSRIEYENINDGRAVISIPMQNEIKVICLAIDIPKSWRLPMRPGMFIYIKDSSISQWQSHPFSISSVDLDKMSFTFYVKALGDWTALFVQKMQFLADPSTLPIALVSKDFALEIEGPYIGVDGEVTNDFGDCLFIAGGVGLTGVSMSIIQRHQRQAHQSIVWLVRTTEEMTFLSKEILTHMMPPYSTSRIRIFVTQQAPQGLSAVVTTETQDSILHVNHKMMTSDMFTRRSTIFASVLGIAFSFLIARLISCNEAFPLAGSTKSVHECSILFHKTKCFVCNPGSDPSSSAEPCCSIEICFLSFRGMPVITTLFLAPIIAFLLNMIFIGAWSFFGRFTGSSSKLWQHVTNFMRQSPTNKILLFAQDVDGSECMGNEEVVSLDDGGVLGPEVQIEYLKPSIINILKEFCAETGEEGGEDRGAIVCGPKALVNEVEKHYDYLRQEKVHLLIASSQK